MSTASPAEKLLEDIVKDARNQFILAKADGKLEAGEVVQIAVSVAQKVQKLGGLSGTEKKAVVLLSLKRGLEAAGGIPGIAEEMRAEMEKQLLASASAAIDVAVAVSQGKIDLRKPAVWKAVCLPLCSAAAQLAAAKVPKDVPLLKEALGAVAQNLVAQNLVAQNLVAEKAKSASQESPAEIRPAESAEALPVADTAPAKPDEKAPSPAGADAESPEKTHVVKFE
jgi:hypothetical protein